MTSVVIPVFNGAHVLPTTLPAVLALDADEIVWVNDGSTDQTGRLLADAAAQSAYARVVTLDTNAGRSAARNAGVAAATGDTLVFFDADVEPPPDAARRLAEAATADGAVASVSRIDPVPDDPAEPYQDYATHAARGPDRSFGAGAVLPWRFFLSGASALRRDALAAVGGFREDVAYGEDQALACALSHAHPDRLRLAATTVRLHDLGDLGRAVRHARAYGRAAPGIASECPDLVPRAVRQPRGLGGLARVASGAIETVIAISPSGPVRRRLTRYLLASHAVHAAALAPPPARPDLGRDGV